MSLQDNQERKEFRNYVALNEEEAKYHEAAKRVKKIKGFYTHALVYIVINIMIVILNVQDLKEGESYFKIENFFTLFFWGIGVLVHALSVFLPNFVFGKNWEERKIREYMEIEKNKQNQWQ